MLMKMISLVVCGVMKPVFTGSGSVLECAVKCERSGMASSVKVWDTSHLNMIVELQHRLSQMFRTFPSSFGNLFCKPKPFTFQTFFRRCLVKCAFRPMTVNVF